MSKRLIRFSELVRAVTRELERAAVCVHVRQGDTENERPRQCPNPNSQFQRSDMLGICREDSP